jgi:hypothetical protein
MDKNSRLQLIRNRAKQNIPLSPVAAQALEELRKEDSDLGGLAAFGEVLAPDSTRIDSVPVTEDESEYETKLISPLMRASCD